MINESNINQVKLKKSSIVAYGIGGAGQVVAINLFYMYFIFFLTTVANVNPAIAGTISLFAVIWDAITDPIIGYLSDRFNGNKYGKRVPFILFSCIPLGISMYLLFTDFGFDGSLKIIFIFFANILFWTFFTSTDIPYISLASDLTNDYDERTKLRTSTTAFSNAGSIIITSGVMFLLDMLLNKEASQVQAWSIIGLTLGAFVIICYMLSALLLKGEENIAESVESNKSEKDINPIIGFLSLFKVKQYRFIVIVSFLMNFFTGIVSSSMMFYYLYVAGLDYSKIALIPFIPTVIFILSAVPVGSLAIRIGKKKCMIIGLFLMMISSVFYVILPPTFSMMVLIQSIMMIGNTAFWILIYSLNFDIVEIDEFINNKRRDGQLISLNSFVMKLGVAVGMWIGGILLSVGGFDAVATVQTSGVENILRLVVGGIPAILTFLAIISLCMYKVNKKNFDALKMAIELRKEGREYSTTEFEEIL